MNILVDTSVWSLALRRNVTTDDPTVAFLTEVLDGTGQVFATGLILQELLQGFRGPRNRERIIDRFSSLPFVIPDRTDHIDAANLRNRCRRRGVQLGTIDALLAQLCTRHDLTMLTTDQDFSRVAQLASMRVWKS